MGSLKVASRVVNVMDMIGKGHFVMAKHLQVQIVKCWMEGCNHYQILGIN